MIAKFVARNNATRLSMAYSPLLNLHYNEKQRHSTIIYKNQNDIFIYERCI